MLCDVFCRVLFQPGANNRPFRPPLVVVIESGGPIGKWESAGETRQKVTAARYTRIRYDLVLDLSPESLIAVLQKAWRALLVLARVHTAN